MIDGMPRREHTIKFQCSIPISHTKQSRQMFQRVVDSAAGHLRALAGSAAHGVDIRAIYQDRGPGELGIVWRDILVVCVFNGPLNEHTKKMKIERNAFEFKKQTGKEATPLDFGGDVKKGKVLLS